MCVFSVVQLQHLSLNDITTDSPASVVCSFLKELFIFKNSQITGRKIIIVLVDHRSNVGDECFKLDFPFKPLKACT